MDECGSRKVLHVCLGDIARLNRCFMAYRPLLHWLDSLALPAGKPPVHILDVGCGYGDGLRRIERWAKTRGVAVELTGLDLNPDAVAIAAEETAPESGIEWVGQNIFSYSPRKPIHIVVSSIFAHHLSDAEIVRFVQWMEEQAEIGWFINDLSRAAVPYQLLKAFSQVTGLHPFVQHDGPVSIARAFVPADWKKLCAPAGLADN